MYTYTTIARVSKNCRRIGFLVRRSDGGESIIYNEEAKDLADRGLIDLKCNKNGFAFREKGRVLGELPIINENKEGSDVGKPRMYQMQNIKRKPNKR